MGSQVLTEDMIDATLFSFSLMIRDITQAVLLSFCYNKSRLREKEDRRPKTQGFASVVVHQQWPGYGLMEARNRSAETTAEVTRKVRVTQ